METDMAKLKIENLRNHNIAGKRTLKNIRWAVKILE